MSDKTHRLALKKAPDCVAYIEVKARYKTAGTEDMLIQLGFEPYLVPISRSGALEHSAACNAGALASFHLIIGFVLYIFIC